MITNTIVRFGRKHRFLHNLVNGEVEFLDMVEKHNNFVTNTDSELVRFLITDFLLIGFAEFDQVGVKVENLFKVGPNTNYKVNFLVLIEVAILNT